MFAHFSPLGVKRVTGPASAGRPSVVGRALAPEPGQQGEQPHRSAQAHGDHDPFEIAGREDVPHDRIVHRRFDGFITDRSVLRCRHHASPLQEVNHVNHVPYHSL